MAFGVAGIDADGGAVGRSLVFAMGAAGGAANGAKVSDCVALADRLPADRFVVLFAGALFARRLFARALRAAFFFVAAGRFLLAVAPFLFFAAALVFLAEVFLAELFLAELFLADVFFFLAAALPERFGLRARGAVAVVPRFDFVFFAMDHSAVADKNGRVARGLRDSK